MVQDPQSDPGAPQDTPEARKVTITFAGKPLVCSPGTSLAVALWDHGIRHLSHSHKYGHPRGLTCARGHCTNCLMRVDGVPNIRTCETPLRDGLNIETQDSGTFYGAPMQKLLSLGSQWMPVGFYYKWFTKPATLSRFFLDRIRPLTGVGRLPDGNRPLRALPAAASDVPEQSNRPEKANTDLGHFETIIVGAGPSGLEAAATCSGTTLLVDDMADPGGQRLAALRELDVNGSAGIARFSTLVAARKRLEAAVAAIPRNENFQFLGGAKAIAGYFPDGLLVRQGEKLMIAHFDNLVWSAGALDTFGLFPGNDTPGLFGPRAIYRLLTRDGLDVNRQHALLIGGGLDFWLSAALLAARGAIVNLVITGTDCQTEVAAAVDMNWPLNTGLKLKEVKGTGGHRIQATFVPRRGTPGPMGSHMHLEADLAVICEPGKPAYDIPYQLGADLALDPDRGGYVPRGCGETEAEIFAQTLPGGANVTFAGETLGLLPARQESR